MRHAFWTGVALLAGALGVAFGRELAYAEFELASEREAAMLDDPGPTLSWPAPSEPTAGCDHDTGALMFGTD